MKKGAKAQVACAILLVTLVASGCEATPPSEHFTVRISGPDVELAYVCFLIESIAYFETRGYTPELPDHPAIDTLLAQAATGSFDKAACTSLSTVFTAELYELSRYQQPYRRVVRGLAEIDPAHEAFLTLESAWGFRTFETYEVLLTLYGPGGTFDADSGRIWLMVTDAGGFKMGDDPAQVILHEAVHIGIEKPIVRAYNLSQPATERIADRLMVDRFGELFPEYALQAIGDPAIDPYLDHADSWERLPDYVADFVAQGG